MDETTTAEQAETTIAEPATTKGDLVSSSTPRVDSFVQEMLPAKSAKALWAGLPEHISRDVFKRNLHNALMTNPNLMNYPPALVFREVSKAAALGLLLDPQLGEAYLIEAFNAKAGKKQPQLRIGYKGMCKLARQTGSVNALYSHAVHENDDVEADLGYPKRYHHKPNLFGERGQVVGYVAVIGFKDGTFDFEPMKLDECLAIRDRSDAWKAFKRGDIKSTPWETDQGEMCRKTVLRRLLKRQDQSPEMRMAQDIEDAAEFPHLIDHVPAEPARAPAPPSEEPDQKPRDVSGERTKSAPRGDRNQPKEPEQRVTAPAPAEKPKPKMTAKDVLNWIEDRYSKITAEQILDDPDLLGTIWETEALPKLEAIGAFPPDMEAAQAILREHERRLEP